MATDLQHATPPPAAESTIEQKPTEQLAPAPSKVPVRMGMTPTTIEEGWRLAQMFAQSEVVPKTYRNRPADILVAIQYGMEIGFAPMQALQSIAVINGRASVWGDGFLALLMSSPLYRDHDEFYEVAGERRDGVTLEDMKRDDTTAVCSFWRHGKATPVTRRFSIGQAKKSGLWGKEGPWTTYPDRMMAMRARSWAGRDTFPDILRGIHTAEEARDLPAIESLDPPPIVQPRRASETPKPSAPGVDLHQDTSAAPVHEPERRTAAATVAQELRGLLVTGTSFVRPKAGEPYYEIATIRANDETCVFMTRDEQLYKEAVSFEGTEHRITAGYHTEPKGTTDPPQTARVLDAIALYEGSTGELFT